MHQSRGCCSHRAFDSGVKASILSLYQERYSGFGPTLAAEKLEETAEAAMRLVVEWIERYGIPSALYTDRKNVYVTDREPTIAEQLKGEAPQTAFGRACAKLSIKIKKAYSPQAKGRVERKNGMYQDRLVKEFGLRGIREIDAANRFLKAGYLDQLNEKFSVKAALPQDDHRTLPDGADLLDIFCFEETRQVQNDWTVRYRNRFYQIKRESQTCPKAKEDVVMRERLDGSLQMLYREKSVVYESLPERPTANALQSATCQTAKQGDSLATVRPKKTSWYKTFGRSPLAKTLS